MFVHGVLLTRAQWSPQMRILSARYRCIAVDLPGHGALAEVPFTREAAADVVADAIAAACPRGRAVVVGLSLGGYVAIDTADRHPERVAGLVLAGCSAEPRGPAALPLRMYAWVLAHAPRGLLDAIGRACLRFRYPPRNADPIIEHGFWPRGGAAALRTLAVTPYLERLALLWTPVLLVNGALDLFFAPGGEAWAQSCRAGSHVVVGRATHLMPLDRPRTFSTLVARFVEGIDETA
jgi:pimeloyl-ACP methyl ester carboxylesterase